MTKLSLRALSKSYARGQLTKDEYRQQRAQLIDDIVAGRTPVIKYEPPPPPKPEPETVEIPRAPREPEKKPPIALIAGALVVIVAVVAVVLLWPEGAPEAPPPAGKQAVETAVEPAPPSPAEELILAFLEADDWQADAVEAFRGRWDALNISRPELAADEALYQRLTNAIYAQIVEERAAADVGSESAVGQQHMLIELAEHLGIDDPRLRSAEKALAEAGSGSEAAPAVMPEPPAAAPPPEPVALAAQETPATVSEPAVTPAPAAEAGADMADAQMSERAPAETATPEVAAANPPAAPVAADTEVEAPAPPPAETAPAPTPAAAGASEAGAATAAEPQPPPATAEPKPAAGTTVAAAASDSVQAKATSSAKQPSAEAAKAQRRQNCNAGLLKSRRPYCRDRLKDGGAGPVLVVLPAGEFTMGGSKPHEQPQHQVRIGYNFAMSTHEIAAGDYQRFCKATGRSCPKQPWQGDDYPAVNVSWNDATAYVQWLSEQTGWQYRLPTEAEWEYAARAGTRTIYPFGDELLPTHARFTYATTPDSPLPNSDRSINRNDFRLYHMLGNVREWVADSWFPSYSGAPTDGSARIDAAVADRVIRGGSYQDGADELRSAARTHQPAGAADTVTGFRVVQQLGQSGAVSRAGDADASRFIAGNTASRVSPSIDDPALP